MPYKRTVPTSHALIAIGSRQAFPNKIKDTSKNSLLRTISIMGNYRAFELKFGFPTSTKV